MLEQMFEMKTAVKLKLANNGFMLVRISFELSIKELIQCNCSYSHKNTTKFVAFARFYNSPPTVKSHWPKLLHQISSDWL